MLLHSMLFSASPANSSAGNVDERVARDGGRPFLPDCLSKRTPRLRVKVLGEGVAQVAEVVALGGVELVAVEAGARRGGVEDGLHLVAGVGARAGAVDGAVAQAELELVVAAHAVREVAAVEAQRVLRPREGLARRCRAPPGARCPAHPVAVLQPALRDQVETRVVAGGLARQEEAGTEHVVPLDLAEPAASRPFLALVPQRAVEVGEVARGGCGSGAAGLDLAALEPEDRDHVAAGRLPVELGGVGLEQRLVELLADVPDADVVAAVAAVEPELVLQDGAAQVERHVRDLLRVVGLVVALQARVAHQLVRYVRPLQVVVGEVAAGGPVERIGAALGHDADAHAAGRDLVLLPPVEKFTSSKASNE